MYNYPYQQIIRGYHKWTYLHITFMRWLLVGMIGCVTGLVAFAVNYGIEKLLQLKHEQLDSVYFPLSGGSAMYGLLVLLGFNSLFVLISAGLVVLMVNEDQKNWDVKIETVLVGYRHLAKLQQTILHFLLFQKEMRLLIDNEIMQNEESHNHMESEMSIVIEALLQTREKLCEATGLNISLAQREQKELYDRKHNSNELQVGTTVLNKNTRQKQCKGGKMDDRWLGPYPINRCIGRGVYELKNMEEAVLMTKVNVNRLKVYKYPDEHKESNEDMDAKSEKNEGTDARSDEMKKQMLKVKRMEGKVDQIKIMERKVHQMKIMERKVHQMKRMKDQMLKVKRMYGKVDQ
eukprot:Em0009g867a